MKWWKWLRRSNQRTGVDIGPRSLRLEMPGWSMVEQTDQMTVWQDVDGDALSLAPEHGTFGLLHLSDEDEVRQRCRALAEHMGSGLVEAAVISGAYGPAVLFVYKRLDKPAFVFTGMLLVRTATTSWVWTVVARERGTTGVREAVVAVQLANERKLTPESYETSWAQDPYDPTYSVVDRSTLRYLSDDDSYDPQFPQHPLSKVRRELRRLLTVKLDPPALDRAAEQLE